nr:unnamed protein product [Digitaria exilis]CAB3483686.1 unnamed protein product [Digitaria exilis]
MQVGRGGPAPRGAGADSTARGPPLGGAAPLLRGATPATASGSVEVRRGESGELRRRRLGTGAEGTARWGAWVGC